MATNIFILDQSICKVYFAGQAFKQKKVALVEQWCAEEKADLCFNLSLFNSNGLACSYVRAQGKDIAYGCDEPGKSKNWSNRLVINSGNECNGYCNGIIDGVVKLNTPFGGSTQRNGIGITTKGDVIIAQSGTKLTELAFCNAVNTFVHESGQTVKLFVLQDGGGSVSEYSSISKLGFYPREKRKVATVTCVKFLELPTITSVVYNGSKGDDTGWVQLVIGGIEADKKGGSGTANRIRQAQAALGFPKNLQCGIASAYTLSRLGFKTNIK